MLDGILWLILILARGGEGARFAFFLAKAFAAIVFAATFKAMLEQIIAFVVLAGIVAMGVALALYGKK